LREIRARGDEVRFDLVRDVWSPAAPFARMLDFARVRSTPDGADVFDVQLLRGLGSAECMDPVGSPVAVLALHATDLGRVCVPFRGVRELRIEVDPTALFEAAVSFRPDGTWDRADGPVRLRPGQELVLRSGAARTAGERGGGWIPAPPAQGEAVPELVFVRDARWDEVVGKDHGRVVTKDEWDRLRAVSEPIGTLTAVAPGQLLFRAPETPTLAVRILGAAFGSGDRLARLGQERFEVR
jgi:hypothetical protein